jgi:hypothetical protein
MKRKKNSTLICFLLVCVSTYSQSHVYQKGYTKKDGTYVQPHYKTESNRTNRDNFSTQTNTNFYTGARGSRAKDYSPGVYNYGQDKTIHTGPKGGQYYYNSKGKKTYIPKQK